MAKKLWYLHICDFVGNEENYVFDEKDEAYKSFAIVLNRELADDDNRNKDGKLVDTQGYTFKECVERKCAETSAYIIIIKECEMATSKQFMW